MPQDVESEVTDYPSALHFLYERINYEKIGNTPYTSGNYRLDRMRQLLKLVGNPHHDYDIIHVAGTKGKGTASTLIADCLLACGRKTGLSTSPHLVCLEERIRFQDRTCTSQELVELTQVMQTASKKLEEQGGGRATFFELTTAMGMLHFARCGAEAVVLEVGMGGRLDSTNVCSPLVSVITSISLDHQAQLGNTLALIAREKAGIIKPSRPVVCVSRGEEARAVMIEIARAQSAPLRLIDRDFSVSWRALSPNREYQGCQAEIVFCGDRGRTGNAGDSLLSNPVIGTEPTVWNTRLLGRHQADNIAAALATLDVMRGLGWQLPPDAVRSAIANSHPPARLEVVGYEPLAILDSAHNPASIGAGLQALAEHFPGVPQTIVFAASRDKDWPQMLLQLLQSGTRLVLTAYRENPRALPTEELYAAAKLISVNASAAANCAEIYSALTPADAWSMAQRITPVDELIYATGSFFLAAELLLSFGGKRNFEGT